MGRLFGTDGIRGIVNEDLTCELSMLIGKAAAFVLCEHLHHKPRILIGTDTRASAEMLTAAISAGVTAVGADCGLLGTLPTPAVAYLVRKTGADAGIMISASHNPARFNGIKIFGSNGYKIPDEYEAEIERLVLSDSSSIPLCKGDEIGRVIRKTELVFDYIEYLKSTANADMSGMRILIDCANGSASATAPKLFLSLGADVTFINASPDGANINKHCGSLHVDMLSKLVTAGGYDLGLAFDGDADRLLSIDSDGNLVDGDKFMAICAKYYKDKNKLIKNTVVATVMSNLGLFKFGEENGITFAGTKVGDRFVLEEMLKEGYVLGGEQSGHIIFLDYSTTGDGQLSAVQLLKIIKESKKSLSELASVMTYYPQRMINVTVSNDKKAVLDSDNEVRNVISKWEDILAGSGRVLVRASGTEPLIRVMAEGKDEDQTTACVTEIADVIRRAVG